MKDQIINGVIFVAKAALIAWVVWMFVTAKWRAIKNSKQALADLRSPDPEVRRGATWGLGIAILLVVAVAVAIWYRQSTAIAN